LIDDEKISHQKLFFEGFNKKRPDSSLHYKDKFGFKSYYIIDNENKYHISITRDFNDRFRLYDSDGKELFRCECTDNTAEMIENGKKFADSLNFVISESVDVDGIDKNDIIKYCEDVYNVVGENEYFTLHSLKAYNISSKLELLGFDDLFYAGILASSSNFKTTQYNNVSMFYKGEYESVVSKRNFILYLLSKYDSIDVDDLIQDCFDIYGVKIPDKYEITSAIKGTNFYYDEIMEKIYRDKNLYYEEIED
jgi:hypothetical protein